MERQTLVIFYTVELLYSLFAFLSNSHEWRPRLHIRQYYFPPVIPALGVLAMALHIIILILIGTVMGWGTTILFALLLLFIMYKQYPKKHPEFEWMHWYSFYVVSASIYLVFWIVTLSVPFMLFR